MYVKVKSKIIANKLLFSHCDICLFLMLLMSRFGKAKMIYHKEVIYVIY